GVEAFAAPYGLPARPVVEIGVLPPGPEIRTQLWRRALPALDARELAHGFALTPGEIRDIAGEALAAVSGEAAQLQPARVREGIKRRLRNELGELARPVSIKVGWDELVIPDDDRDRVRELIARARHHHAVYDGWGFGRRIGYGKGMVALFSGPPGTGKTLLAGL